MGGDQLIIAVGRALHHDPNHADLRAAVAVDRDQRCRVGTEELACCVVEFHGCDRIPAPRQVRYFVIHAVAWSLADLAGRVSPGLDEVGVALSFREPGAQR
jgi:hypothetical protein